MQEVQDVWEVQVMQGEAQGIQLLEFGYVVLTQLMQFVLLVWQVRRGLEQGSQYKGGDPLQKYESGQDERQL